MTSGTTCRVVPCESWIEAVSARLDGELSGAEDVALADHLRNCRGCRQLAARLEQQHRRLRLAVAPVVPDLAEQVLAGTRPVEDQQRDGARRLNRRLPTGERRGRATPGRRPFVGVAVAAAAFAALLGGLGVLRSRPGPAPELALGAASVQTAPRGQASVLSLRVANHGGADRLLGASSTIADHVELHQLDDVSGATVMRSVTSVPVPAEVGTDLGAGTTTHVMLIGLLRDLRPGDRVMVVLRFARSGSVPVDAVVGSS